MPNLRIDFHESGKGDTIIITFPGGGVGIVDAHPSTQPQRPAILNLCAGKKIHFVCLTHPHEDHGLDLVPLIESGMAIDSFWHSGSSLDAFVYYSGEITNFPSAVKDFVANLHRTRAEFLINLYSAVFERNLPLHKLQANIEAEMIDGVEIHCISPEESISNQFAAAYKQRAEGKKADLPNLNLLSAVLVLKFGESVIVLGSDALRPNWETAVQRYRKKKLPKAHLLKVPHHGALNAIILKPKSGQSNYLDICVRNPKPHAVLFAGTNKHPEPMVFKTLQEKTEIICLGNGLKNSTSFNPLRLAIPGAKAEAAADVCNLVVSYEITDRGVVRLINGAKCNFCLT